MPLSSRQIDVAFQKIFTAENQVWGGEFLCREIVDGEACPPLSLISTVNESNMHLSFDKEIVSKAFAKINALFQEGVRHNYNLNIHPESISSAGFSDWLINTAKEYGIDCSSVIIEITESSDFTDNNTFRDELINLKKNAFKIALDDFGCDYSNLERFLLAYPFIDYLKINEKIFNKRHIFQRIVAGLSHLVSLDTVIAECIEDEETVSYLKSCGIQLYQGFHYHKPEIN